MSTNHDSFNLRKIRPSYSTVVGTFIVSVLLFSLFDCSKTKQANTNQNTGADGGLSLELFQQGGEFGYRDAAGTVVIKPHFDEAGEFSWGLARVKPNAKGGWGYIDGSGNVVIRPQFEAAGDFDDGMTIVLSNGEFTYIGPDGVSLGAFDEDYPAKLPAPGDTLYVIHPNGLIARASGDLNAPAAFQVKPNEAVVCAYDTHEKRAESVDGLRGSWLLVRYRGKTGYLFDLYLSRYSQNVDHLPLEHYNLAGSSVPGDEYTTYALTKFASGGRSIVHNGPNWTESREIVPDASTDQVIARLKLNPAGNLGSLASMFHGTPGTFTTEKGDTVVTRLRRDTRRFLTSVSMSTKNEEFSFDATIDTYNTNAVEITTTLSTQPANQQPADNF